MAAQRIRGARIEFRAYAGVDPATGRREYLQDSCPAASGKRELARVEKALDGRAQMLAAQRRRARRDGVTPQERIARARLDDVTFGQAATAWLDEHLETLEESGRDTPDVLLRAYVLPTLADVALWRVRSTLTAAEAEQFPELVSLKALYRTLEAGGAVRKTKLPDGSLVDVGLGAGSLQRIHGIVKQVLGYAYARGWVAGNPARETRPAPYRRKRRPLPDDVTLGRFLGYLSDEHPGAYLSALLVMSGPRPNEVAALRISSFDLERRTARVGDEGIVMVPGPAGGERPKLMSGADTDKRRARTITISASVADAVKARLQEMAMVAELHGVAVHPDAFLFSPDPDGSTFFAPDWAGQAFRRWVLRAGQDRYDRSSRTRVPGSAVAELPTGFTIYDMRHWGITKLLEARHPVADVAERFGTSARMIYQAYAHAIGGQDDGMADTLDRLTAGP